MNKKQLYEQIMSSISKEVKKVLNESRRKLHRFSNNDFKEIEEMMREDINFYNAYCQYANIDYYDSYDESIIDFIDFLKNELDDETTSSKEIHAWYILDEPDGGTSWMKLKSGKLLNLDNLYMEYKSIIEQE